MKKLSAFLILALAALISTPGLSGRAAIACNTVEITDGNIVRQ